MRDAQQELDDEILSACHDGELPTTEADAVRRRLAREPELADRLHAIQSVDAATVGAFRAQDGHALPERVLELLDAAEREEREARVGAAAVGKTLPAQARRRWIAMPASAIAAAVRRLLARASGER